MNMSRIDMAVTCFAVVLCTFAYAQSDNLKKVRAAADRNDAAAQYRLGVAYLEGDPGLERSASEACRWFRRAAEAGYALAQNDLAGCFMNGEGVPRDVAQGALWYRKAAEQGLAVAEVNIGRAYRWGRGVDRDYSEALRWFRKAAEQGSGSAEVEIGELYEAGLGVARDLDAAEQHYGAAADRIRSIAFVKLAQLAEGGVGRPRNVVEAYKWYTLFLPFAGDDESTYRARRDALASEMSRDQIDEALRRADQWTDAHKPKRPR